MKTITVLFLGAFMVLPLARPGFAQDFKKWAAKTAEYKQWLDSRGPNGTRLWIKLDGKQRPHRLYLGEGFFRADLKTQERFVETYSSYLAGHPEKFMLIDLFDARSNRAVGEFGWGGFKLYPEGLQIAERVRTVKEKN